MNAKGMVCLVLSGALLLSGCFGATYGRKFDTSRISEIKKGQTTKQEIIAMFGQAKQRMIRPDGKEALTYLYTEGRMKTNPLIFVPIVNLFVLLFSKTKVESEARTLSIVLKDGVVDDYAYTESGSGFF